MDENKKLEELTDCLFEQLPLESPSIDFTQKVMQRLETSKAKSSLVYRPLIPKKLLLTIYAIIAILLVVLVFTIDFQTNSMIREFDYSKYLEKLSFEIPRIEVSKTVLYGILALGVMLMIQLTLLKNQLGKRIV